MIRDSVEALVLGAAGPIGQAVERRAAAVGMQVHLTSRRSTTHPLDADDRAEVRRVLEHVRPRVVIDLSNPFAATRDVENSAATVQGVLESAIRARVDRFVYASSGAVYGDVGDSPFLETNPLRGAGPYARWKRAAERSIAEAAADAGMSSIALRIFNVFGPACHSSLINRLISGPPPLLASGARFVRDYVHVDDVADAIVAAARAPSATGAVNIATGIPVDNLQLAGAARVGAYLPADAITSYSVGDPSRALGALGWRARRSALAELRAGVVA